MNDMKKIAFILGPLVAAVINLFVDIPE